VLLTERLRSSLRALRGTLANTPASRYQGENTATTVSFWATQAVHARAVRLGCLLSPLRSGVCVGSHTLPQQPVSHIQTSRQRTALCFTKLIETIACRSKHGSRHVPVFNGGSYTHTLLGPRGWSRRDPNPAARSSRAPLPCLQLRSGGKGRFPRVLYIE
jgi:hypothetical protein